MNTPSDARGELELLRRAISLDLPSVTDPRRRATMTALLEGRLSIRDYAACVRDDPAALDRASTVLHRLGSMSDAERAALVRECEAAPDAVMRGEKTPCESEWPADNTHRCYLTDAW